MVSGRRAVGGAEGWTHLNRSIPGFVPGVSLLLVGEFQSVAEDLESLLFITESTCLGRLTVESEHLPKKPRKRHTDVHTGHMTLSKRGKLLRRHELLQTERVFGKARVALGDSR